MTVRDALPAVGTDRPGGGPLPELRSILAQAPARSGPSATLATGRAWRQRCCQRRSFGQELSIGSAGESVLARQSRVNRLSF